MASSSPPPMQAPPIAATTGFSALSSARITVLREGSAVDLGEPNSRISAPPEKARGLPISTRAFTFASASARASPSTISRRRSNPRPFTGGLFMVTTAAWPCSSKLALLMPSLFDEECRDYPPARPGERSTPRPRRPLLRRNEDGQDADDLPPFRLLDHHQIDVETVSRRLRSRFADAQLRRRVDLRNPPADRDDPQLFLVDVDLPGALVAFFQVFQRRVPVPDGLAPADPEHVRRVRQQGSHALQVVRVLGRDVLVEYGAYFVLHRRGASQRRDHRQGGHYEKSLQHSFLQPFLLFFGGPAWIRTRDQRIMSPLL